MIIPMKKAMLVVLRDDREAVTEALQRCGELMPIPPEDYSRPDSAGDLIRIQEALKTLRPYQEKKGMFAQRPEVTASGLQEANPEGQVLLKEIEETVQLAENARSEIQEITAKIEELRPWIRMDIPVESLGGTKMAGIYSGYVDPGKADKLWETAELHDGAVMQLDVGSRGMAVLIYTYRKEEDQLLDELTAIGFSQADPPGSGYPKETLAKWEKDLSIAKKAAEDADARLIALGKQSSSLELFCDQTDAAQQRADTPFGETAQTVYLEGWVRKDRTERLKKAIDKATDCYDLTFAEPAEGEEPPTVTKNNRFISQFETITDMFSRPHTGEVDPNPVMGPWYWLIFGLMMGDAGYGLMMLVGLWAFRKLKKPKGDFAKLVNVMLYSSITTIFWGVVFGSYFGATWHPLLFAPLDNPMGMLIFCLILGVLHIFSGMAVKMYADIRAGHFWDAIFDQFSWMMAITGLGLLFLPKTRTVGMVLAISGAVIILLTAGRAKKGIFGKITGGFGGLYGITGYMSDILSYSRILALSLATGVVGMVMNLLAGMVQGSVFGFICSLLIYAVGHVFNLAMGLLSAYVHDSRLQYIEFFNKFYEGGGYAFKPLQMNPRFVEIHEGREN